jgi:hypothetical protein
MAFAVNSQMPSRLRVPWHQRTQAVVSRADNALGAQAATQAPWMSVANDMMSGAAMAPYRASMREAAARQASNQRASAGALIDRGASQAASRAIAQGAEDQIRRGKMDAMLNEAMATQNMAMQGAQLGMQGQQMEDAQANATATLQLQRDELASRNAIADKQMNLERSRMRTQSQQQSDYMNYMMGRLDLDRELGRGELDLRRSAQESDDAYRNRVADLQETVSSREHDIAMRAQAWTEEYGRNTLALQNRLADLNMAQLDMQDKWQAQNLAYQYEALSSQDKIALAQIDLGREELSTRDKQTMRELGISEKGIDLANDIQQLQVKNAEILSSAQAGYYNAGTVEQERQTEESNWLSNYNQHSGVTGPGYFNWS